MFKPAPLLFLFFFITGFFFDASYARAQDALQDDDAPSCHSEKFASLEEIPEPLRRLHFRVNGPLEEYVAGHLGFIRKYAEDRIGLTKKDLERKLSNLLKANTKRHATNLMKAYEQNMDGKIDRNELNEFVQHRFHSLSDEERDKKVSRLIQDIFEYDLNADGFVTFPEMLTPNKIGQKIIKDGHKLDPLYLQLDQNGNGALTVVELERSARKAFATVDADCDTLISNDEFQALKTVDRKSQGGETRRRGIH